MSFDSDDSDINFILAARCSSRRVHFYKRSYPTSDDGNLFADEPLADEAWAVRYEQELIAYV